MTCKCRVNKNFYLRNKILTQKHILRRILIAFFNHFLLSHLTRTDENSPIDTLKLWQINIKKVKMWFTPRENHPRRTTKHRRTTRRRTLTRTVSSDFIFFSFPRVGEWNNKMTHCLAIKKFPIHKIIKWRRVLKGMRTKCGRRKSYASTGLGLFSFEEGWVVNWINQLWYRISGQDLPNNLPLFGFCN